MSGIQLQNLEVNVANTEKLTKGNPLDDTTNKTSGNNCQAKAKTIAHTDNWDDVEKLREQAKKEKRDIPFTDGAGNRCIMSKYGRIICK